MGWVRKALVMAEGQSVSWALLTKADGATLLGLRPALGGAGAMSWVSAGLGDGRGAERKLGAVDKSRWRLLSLRPELGRSRGAGAIKRLVMAEGQSASWALLTKVDGATLLLNLRPELGRSRGGAIKGLVMAEGQSVSWALLTKPEPGESGR